MEMKKLFYFFSVRNSFKKSMPKASLMQLACLFELGFGEETSTIHILKKLFDQNWGEEFCIVEPGDNFSQFRFLNRAGAKV